MNQENVMEVEQREPIPLESLTPLPEVNTGRELEKSRYWNKLLTGDLSAVPADVRRKTGADDESQPAEERDYRLMNNINRSWVVDHRDMSREQVLATWPELRRNLTRELGVRNSEPELYTALSIQNQDAPDWKKARKLYEDNYKAVLEGRTVEQPDNEDERLVCRNAMQHAAQAREEYMPLAESVSDAWAYIKARESSPLAFPDMVMNVPGLIKAVDALADMEPADRARVYTIARSLDSTRRLEEKPAHLGEAVLHSMRRGSADLGHAALQGLGHATTALVKAAGETFDSEEIRRFSVAADKRLQTLHELRQLAQGEIFPIDLGDDAGLAEQMTVDAAGALPGAALAFMGGAGFAALTVAGTGAAVAEARKRSPKGRQELQTAAGILGAGLQSAIYMGMSRIGAQMLDRSIKGFLNASGSGVKGYSLAALNGLATLTAENAKLLLAGKAAQAAEMGAQELAARVDKVASNIDWEAFGDNFTDIEANMREAAMNLPFVLIAAGRAALHHFRSPSALLDNGELLAEWGVNEPTRKRILEEPDIHLQSDMLRDALRSSKRFAGSGALELLLRSLKLLNTEHHIGFKEEQQARDFLRKRSDFESLAHPKPEERNLSDPETILTMAEHASGRRRMPLNIEKSLPYLQLYDSWFQKGNGQMLLNHDAAKTRYYAYCEMLGKRGNYVPNYLKLNGLYTPYREEGVRALFNDAVLETKNLSYQCLLNTESLDSLKNSYKSLEHAQRITEARRSFMITEMCNAIMRCTEGMSVNESMELLCENLGHMYAERKRASRWAPNWCRNLKPADYKNCYETAKSKLGRSREKKYTELQESYRNILGIRACAEAIMETMPHLRDFQEALSMGHAPKDVFAHLLSREFADELSPDTWKYPPITQSTPNKGDNMYRLDKYKKNISLYSDLSGFDLESCLDGNGKTLWRMKRPDGRYTHWYKAPGYAVNALVGNVETSFLPMGKNTLLNELMQGVVVFDRNQSIYNRRLVFLSQPAVPLEFDHLGRTATRDLCTRWLGDSTLYSAGLEFARANRSWKRFKGRMLDLSFKSMGDGSDRYLVRFNHPLTPLSVSRIRFTTYWNRLLNSGWVSPQEVGDLLVENKIITPERRNYYLRVGHDHSKPIGRMTGAARRAYLAEYHDWMISGDPVTMNARLARCMAELNLRHMIVHLQDSHLPDSVKQWFLTTPFCEYGGRQPFIRKRKRITKANRVDASEVKQMIPEIREFRNKYTQENPVPLENLMRAAYEPPVQQRLEQGWCYALGGDRTFRSAGQAFWNLLDDPGKGWKLLPEYERTNLQTELAEFFGERSPEAVMQELADVLHQYPDLREYGITVRGSQNLSRMLLDPIKTVNVADPVFTARGYQRLDSYDVVKRGYTMENDVSLPEHMRGDERVMPALRLLTELRRSVVRVPYVDNDGIWWNRERYGGTDGKYPRSIDERWTPEVGLQSFLNYFNRVAEMGGDGVLNVCGVPMGGIRPGEIDVSRLRHVTVYSTYRSPEQLVRLMPGQMDSPNPHQRAPYVVHTSNGVPLLPELLSRSNQDMMKALIPLNHFASNVERAYDFATNHYLRVRQVDANMHSLLKKRTKSVEAWAKGDEMTINNEELFMQLFQDSHLAYFLEKRNPEELTRGEALVSELARRILLAEYGEDQEIHTQNLVDFCDKIRENPENMELMKKTLHRVVSPEPDKYSPEELQYHAPDIEYNPTPDDAE